MTIVDTVMLCIGLGLGIFAIISGARILLTQRGLTSIRFLSALFPFTLPAEAASMHDAPLTGQRASLYGIGRLLGGVLLIGLLLKLLQATSITSYAKYLAPIIPLWAVHILFAWYNVASLAMTDLPIRRWSVTQWYMVCGIWLLSALVMLGGALSAQQTTDILNSAVWAAVPCGLLLVGIAIQRNAVLSMP